MSIAFQRAPTVAKGDAITSEQLTKLARAFNDRIRSGLGDPVFRIFYLLLSIFRQVRNPDSSNNFPALAEFFEFYQGLEPEEGVGWPVEGPGEYEGANLASIMNAFVYGIDAIDLDDEQVRLSQVEIGTETTTKGVWELAQRQRGAIDPSSGVYGSPAFQAAREYYKVMTSSLSWHGNAFGGFMPQPELIDTCPDIADGVTRQQFELFFTSLTDPPADTITYVGNCPEQEGHVAYIGYTPFAYYVYTWQSGAPALDRVLPTKEWIEGPYQFGGLLRKTWGNMPTRMLSNFIHEYRGALVQQLQDKYHLQEAFDFQRFFAQQYHLAPQIGHIHGGEVLAVYQSFRITGATHIVAGTAMARDAGGTEHQYADGYVLASALIEATGLNGTATIDFLDDGELIRSVNVTADDDGNATVITMFDTAPTPKLSIRISNEVRLEAGGSIHVQPTELFAYKPELFDAYLLLRLASTDEEPFFHDIRGVDEENSRLISEQYFTLGVINNIRGSLSLPLQQDIANHYVNRNPVWDAARRMSRFIRVITRQQIVGYAVENGKSVLWFKRQATYNGTPVDLFSGIAPDTADASGGIVHVAPESGETNEWMLSVSTKVYHPSESSVWKAENYSDYWPWVNRCHLRPYTGFPRDIINHEGALKEQQGHGDSYLYAPEGPSGYNYAHGANISTPMFSDPKLNFYKSCRIYEPDNEIESIENLVEGNEHVIKVTLTGRMHHTEEAPGHIPRDFSAWDINEIDAEPYRTRENAIRQYLWHAYGDPGNYECEWKMGDSAVDSYVQSETDNPYGSCYPHFILCKLIPEPYIDTNDTQEAADTRITMDVMAHAELYLRALCEGAVDGRTSAEVACLTGADSTFDYSYQNLCYEAFGNRWMNVIPEPVRGDNQEGFGPLPNTYCYAEIFNQLSSAVNLLDKYRVMLPWYMECKTDDYATTTNPTPTWPTPTENCAEAGTNKAIWFSVQPQQPGTEITAGDWTTCTGIEQISSNTIESCDSTLYNMVSRGQRVSYRWQLVDADAIYAIPDEWRDLVNTEQMRFFATVTISGIKTKAVEVASQAESTKCCALADCPGQPGFYWDGAVGYNLQEILMANTHCIEMPAKGVMPQFPAPFSDVYSGTNLSPSDPSGWAVCRGGSSIQRNITPILTDSTYVQIPLEDRAE